MLGRVLKCEDLDPGPPIRDPGAVPELFWCPPWLGTAAPNDSECGYCEKTRCFPGGPLGPWSMVSSGRKDSPSSSAGTASAPKCMAISEG